MSSPAAALGTHAAPLTVEWSGGTVSIQPPDLGRVLAGLENWLIDEDRKLVRQQTKDLFADGFITAEQAAQRMDAFWDGVHAGLYGFGGTKMMGVLGSIQRLMESPQAPSAQPASGVHKGIFYLMALMMDVPLDVMFRVWAEKRDEVMDKFALAMRRGMPDPDDPNSQGATTPQSPPLPDLTPVYPSVRRTSGKIV